MALTVGFDATSAARQAAGIGRYTRELLNALAARHDDTQYRLFYSAGGELHGSLPTLDGRFRVRALPVSDRISNAVWHRMQLPVPVQAVTGAIDLFHSPDFTLPPVPRRPSVLTVHDLAFLTVPDCAYPTLRAYLEVVVPRSVARASHVIAVSQSTKRDLQAYLGVPPERITVIHEGVSPVFKPLQDRSMGRERVRAMQIDAPYILAVGTLEPRKNYGRLLEAYARLRDRGVSHHLVIAGGKGWLFEPVFGRLAELHLEPFVQFVQPDDADLRALYGLADVFVYPSLYEGFGIPPLEALACATPVVCSNTSSLPEIVGDAAELCDPLDVESIAAGIERVLADDALAQRMRGQGPERARHFTWTAAAAQTHALYGEVHAGA